MNMDALNPERKRACLIVNPISGSHMRVTRQLRIDGHLDRNLLDYEIKTTRCPGDAVGLARQAVAEGADFVVAVGGDGTVNEVGQGLVHTGVPMGIIPCGSGNGLARHLGISMDPSTALRDLAGSRIADIDYGKVNGRVFFTTCGIGFDALVSEKFAEGRHRGKLEYVKNILRELRRYKVCNYRMNIDGRDVENEAFLITCANANQWGNDAFIAPEASLNDGFLDLTVIGDVPVLEMPVLMHLLLHKELTLSNLYSGTKCRCVRIYRDEPTLIHCDGEPDKLEGDLDIEIVRSGLKVAVPQRSRSI